ncbi:hypothetical protein [Nostoc sp. UHCC 0251]|uniref:hypothetical protein n=1 Tax=Nostoc sp. UHCC 0251 TaxID=3110240 RepID=UPI002B216B36|nr:hypothetical protein [Nostoc sp. UHCC 0251]MEA5622528.1 hypothetical protein [Nostoc sp. UHCC 0251]
MSFENLCKKLIATKSFGVSVPRFLINGRLHRWTEARGSIITGCLIATIQQMAGLFAIA